MTRGRIHKLVARLAREIHALDRVHHYGIASESMQLIEYSSRLSTRTRHYNKNPKTGTIGILKDVIDIAEKVVEGYEYHPRVNQKRFENAKRALVTLRAEFNLLKTAEALKNEPTICN